MAGLVESHENVRLYGGVIKHDHPHHLNVVVIEVTLIPRHAGSWKAHIFSDLHAGELAKEQIHAIHVVVSITVVVVEVQVGISLIHQIKPLCAGEF